jgi:quinol monooxygenase YgiN
MYASMITGQTQRGQMGEFLTVCRDTILPALRQAPGFRHVALLTDPTTDKMLAMVLWETESEARASEASLGRQWFPMVAPLLSGPPAVEGYNVSLYV